MFASYIFTYTLLSSKSTNVTRIDFGFATEYLCRFLRIKRRYTTILSYNILKLKFTKQLDIEKLISSHRYDHHKHEKRSIYQIPSTIPGRKPGYVHPQSVEPIGISRRYLSSLVPSSYKNQNLPSAGKSNFEINLGDVVTIPWWRRPRPGKRPTPGQSTEPVRLTLKNFMEAAASPLVGPLSPVSTTGSSPISAIDTELYDKTINTMKKILAKKGMPLH